MVNHDVPVLIVGGSLVGLSTAVFLGHHGVSSLVVERHRGTAIHPRAALVNQRAVEAYRAVGLEGEVEEAAAREFVQNGAIVSVESLGGKELDWYFRTINEGVEHISPSARLFVTQIGLEPVLLRAAKRLGATVEHGAEEVSVDHDADVVTAGIQSRGGGDRGRAGDGGGESAHELGLRLGLRCGCAPGHEPVRADEDGAVPADAVHRLERAGRVHHVDAHAMSVHGHAERTFRGARRGAPALPARAREDDESCAEEVDRRPCRAVDLHGDVGGAEAGATRGLSRILPRRVVRGAHDGR
jgi:hypothetical protein